MTYEIAPDFVGWLRSMAKALSIPSEVARVARSLEAEADNLERRHGVVTTYLIDPERKSSVASGRGTTPQVQHPPTSAHPPVKPAAH